MRNLAIFLLVLLFATAAFAGAYMPDSPTIKDVLASQDEEPYVIFIHDTTEKVVKELPPREKPEKGFAAGIEGGYPLVAYKSGDLDAQIGYARINGNQIGLLRGAYTFLRKNEDYTNAKFGLCFFPGNEGLWGLFIELEQYLEKNISVTGSIYPYMVGTDIEILGQATMGGRVYF